MAVFFRHGGNGSYKSAYAVWFEVVPALRAGRLVVTNIEGLKPKEEIERLLGEKFPASSQLVRIFTRSEEGVRLFQNWFCWMPVGALIVIDECQDLFSADVGFKREKTLYQPLENFLDILPPNFSELFYSRWLPTPPEQQQVGDVDDTGRTEYDESGRIVYPYNFYGAFMRHRKYQWDIILITPDWTSIPTWLRGCAQEAYSHRSTDTFFRKRKPRIFNHSPKSTKTDPSTKKDELYCTSAKIPLDVFPLYKSTATGSFNASKSDIGIFKSPRFILTFFIMIVSLGYTLVKGYEILFSSNDSSDKALASSSSQVENLQENGRLNSVDSVSTVASRSSSSKDSRSVVDSSDNFQGHIKDNFANNLNPFSEVFPVFHNADNVYFTALSQVNNNIYNHHLYLFRIDINNESHYLSSNILARYGYSFELLDDCFVLVKSPSSTYFLTCPPSGSSYSVASGGDDKSSIISENVSIFSL